MDSDIVLVLPDTELNMDELQEVIDESLKAGQVRLVIHAFRQEGDKYFLSVGIENKTFLKTPC